MLLINLFSISGLSFATGTSTDLNDFFAGLNITGIQEVNGQYVIQPNVEYSMSFTFEEGDIQFDNGAELIYDIPAGLSVEDVPNATFTIVIRDNGVDYPINGNTIELDSNTNQLKVKFNTGDVNSPKITASGNVQFTVDIVAEFDGTETNIDFGADVSKTFNFNANVGLAISKSGTYHSSTGKVSYKLKVTSTGVNENVLVKDLITGTAFTFNDDVTITSNKTNPVVATTNQVGNGFESTVAQMVNGEVVTFQYTATVDHDLITKFGTKAETENVATAKSTQTPDEVEARSNLSSVVNFKMNTKSSQITPLGNKKYRVDYKIVLNEKQYKTMGGRVIEDSINQFPTNRMTYSGNGISILVTKEDNSTETRDIAWADLSPTANSWQYQIPDGDGKYKYEIAYSTIVDMGSSNNYLDAYGKLRFKNTAILTNPNNNNDSYLATRTIGINGDANIKVNKTVLESSTERTKWQIKISDIPADGTNGVARVIEALPRTQISNVNYYDTYVDGSLVVDGLLPDESYSLQLTPASNPYNAYIYFYQDQAQMQSGLKADPNGNKRTITLTLESDINQDWLDLATDDMYHHNYMAHHNNNTTFRVVENGEESIWGGSARVIPKRKSLKKAFKNFSVVEINGVHYPKLDYVLTLGYVDQEPIAISDVFDKTYLKTYGTPTLSGGDANTQNNVGGSASITDTANGATINIANFPKDNGEFYDYYSVRYSLIPKDQASLDALNLVALASSGYLFNNTASWGELSDQASYLYKDTSRFDKQMTTAPTSSNGYTATFAIVVNKYANDIMPDADVFSIEDELSDNLRLDPDSIVMTSSGSTAGVQVGYDELDNTISFRDLPDNQTITITYDVSVLGSGATSFNNTIHFGDYDIEVVNTVSISASGQGSGDIPSITLIKRDADNINQKLANAVFELLIEQNGSFVNVTGNSGNVTFTTGADGTVLVKGNQGADGWSLQKNKNYKLREITPPVGYPSTNKEVSFRLVTVPSNNTEYPVFGGNLSVTNEREKTTVKATKTWNGGPNQEHTFANSNLILLRRVGNAPYEVVAKQPVKSGNIPGPFNFVWEDLYANDETGQPYQYSVKEAAEVGGIFTLLNGNVYSVTKNGFDVKNTYVPSTDAQVSATKIWVDGPTSDHQEVTLKLFRQAPQTPIELVNATPAVTSTVAGTYEYLWTGLEKTNQYGETYTFTVEEVGVSSDGFITLNNGHVYQVSQVGNVITNKFVVEKEIVTAEKLWIDPTVDPNQPYPHAAPDLVLYRTIGNVTEIVPNSSNPTVTAGSVPGSFKYKWTNIDKTDSSNSPYTFTIKEVGELAGKYTVGGRTFDVEYDNVTNVVTNTLPVHNLGDFVWYDDDKDGVQDAGELGVEGVKVTLTTSNGAITLDTTYTDVNGKYLFTNLPDGDYKVIFSDLPTGYQETSSDVGADDTDSDGLEATGSINGADNLTLDLGIYKTVVTEPIYNLGNYVWYDLNKDGIQDDNEIGVKGVKVKITAATFNTTGGAVITSGGAITLADVIGRVEITDDDGYYLFKDLPDGTYTLEFGIDDSLPSGYEITTTDAGADDAKDSDGLTPTGTINGADNLTLDLGIHKKEETPVTYKIGDFVWYDDNGNGVQDPGESGVEGVTVVLKDENGNILATDVTDSNGKYLFEFLPNGNYKVVFSDLPNDYVVTIPNVGDDAKDSDGLEVAVTVNNADDLTIDLGIVKAPKPPVGKHNLGNYVWYDTNRNGIQDPGETGVKDVLVTLLKPDGSTETTTTDSFGKYLFTGLDDGDYTVKFSNLPTDYIATVSNQGDDAKDSDGLIATGKIAGADNLTLDLGIVEKRTGGGSSSDDDDENQTTTEPTTTEPTPEVTTAPTTEPTTEPTTVPTTTERQFVAGNTPDPNTPDSPDVIVVVDDNGTPLGTYHKEPTPDGGFIYVDDSGVPLGKTKVVKTGNDFPEVIFIMIAVLSLTGAIVLRKATKKTSF